MIWKWLFLSKILKDSSVWSSPYDKSTSNVIDLFLLKTLFKSPFPNKKKKANKIFQLKGENFPQSHKWLLVGSLKIQLKNIILIEDMNSLKTT